MVLTYQSLIQVLLLLLLTTSFALPLSLHQTDIKAPQNLTACAPSPLLIEQFSTFSGATSQKPHVTFFLTNPNGGAPGKMLCTATLGSGERSFNESAFYSCSQPGTGFNYQISTEEGQLQIFQYQVCTAGLVNTISHQVLIAASGSIPTISYPGAYGGEYSESVTGSVSIAVTNVQDVRTINSGQGRLEGQGMNVTCGFVGPENLVIELGSCDLGSVGTGI